MVKGSLQKVTSSLYVCTSLLLCFSIFFEFLGVQIVLQKLLLVKIKSMFYLIIVFF